METRSPDFFVIQLHRHKKNPPTPPGPSYSSSAALRAAPREGAPEPPRWPPPSAPSPALPAGPSARSALRGRQRAQPHTAAHRAAQGHPVGPGTRPARGSCPPPRRGPTGPLRPLPARGSPTGIRRAALVKESGDSGPAGAAPSRRPCPHPRGRRAVQGEPGSAAPGPSPSAGERCPGPGPLPAARRSRCAKVPGTFCAPSSRGSAAAPAPRAGPTGRRRPRALGGPFPRGVQPLFPSWEQSHDASGGRRTAFGPLRRRRSPPSAQRSQLRRSMRGGRGDVPGAAGARRRVTGGGWNIGGDVPGVPRDVGAAGRGCVAVPRGAEQEWRQLDPDVWHRVRHRLARRCVPGHSGGPALPRLRSLVLGSPLSPLGPCAPPRPPLHPGGAPESAAAPAVVQPPLRALLGGPVPGTAGGQGRGVPARRGVEASEVSRGVVGAAGGAGAGTLPSD